MREILFRAKRIDNGEWVEGYYVHHIKRQISPIGDSLKEEDEEHLICFDGFADWNMPKQLQCAHINPETLCQYIGLTDKNSKKIWENDILSAHFDEDYPEDVTYSKVIWMENGFRVIENGSLDTEYLLETDCKGQFQVSGNIFDNPELLEVEHEIN